MKTKLILISLFLFGILSCCIAKHHIVSTNDIISLTQFDILPTGNPMTGPNSLLLDPLQFVQKFGTPNSTSSEQSEMYDQIVTTYHYTGAEVSYISNHLLGINITNSNYVFKLSNGSTTIKVGDNIATISSLFPNSWALRENKQVFVGLKNNGVDVDTNLIFEYDSLGIITSISAQ